MHTFKLVCFILVGFWQSLRVTSYHQYATILFENQSNPVSHFQSPVVVNNRLHSIMDTTDLQTILTRTLQEVFEGPLKGKTISIFLDHETERRIQTDYLLANINTPFSLLRVTEDYEINIFNQTSDQAYKSANYAVNSESNEPVQGPMKYISENNSLLEENSDKLQFYSGNVLVYVTGEQETSTYMNYFSTSWSLAALLLISINENCDFDYLLQTPLATQTSLVTLLCPVFLKSDFESFYYLTFRVYSWQPFHPPKQKLLTLGEWSPFFFPTSKDLFVDRFTSFYGSTLHVSSDRADVPFLFVNTVGEFDGISKRLLDALGNWMNFSYTLTSRAADERWGAKVNGSWVGMLGEIWRGEKDLTINSFGITEERSNDFDFSVSFYRAGFGFHIMEPTALPKWLNLTYPFTLVVWGGLAATLLIMAVIFYLLNYSQNNLLFFDSFIIIAKSVMNQPVNWVPKSWLFRFLIAIWWLGALVIVASYKCNLIAILSIPSYPTKIHTIQQLAKSDYRLCMLDYGDFVPMALAASSDANLYALGSKLDLVPMTEQEWDGDEACVELVLKAHYAHLDFFPYLQNLYNSMGHSHRVYSLKERIYEADVAFFFRKNTPWKYKFDKGIQRLVESKLVGKWQADIIRERRKTGSQGTTESPDVALSLSHLQGPFLILAMGVGISSFIFIFEIFGNRLKCW